MPLFMDVHIIPGVKAKDVASAHELDLVNQHSHSCTCMTYWVDEVRGNVFCLIDAPSKEAVVELHRDAHGLVPSKVIEVDSSLVSSFLGRIYDPESVTRGIDGLKVFEDPSYRILLVTQTEDPVLMKHHLGKEKADEILAIYNEIIRKSLSEHEGTEAERKGTGFVASFSKARQAVMCAIAIQNALKSSNVEIPGFRMAIHGGEPVESTDDLFGDTIQFAGYLCAIAKDQQVAISTPVQELLARESLPKKGEQVCTLSVQYELLLDTLYKSLETNWQDPDFDIAKYCQNMAMSQPQLYRKTVSLTGVSPNTLLMNYRLLRAKDLMKQQRFSISQITFDAGFSSPSYFTKCFKKKYGLLPMAYLDLLH